MKAMRHATWRTVIFFLFILMTVYCYGAGMMDYFAIYEPWKLIDADDFPAFHQYQGDRIIPLFVIPSGIMTILNLLAALFPVAYVSRKLIWFSLLAYAFDWIFSFSMQIPIQLTLQQVKDIDLINDLLRTNWYRFAADTLQFLIVCYIVWTIFNRARREAAAPIQFRQ